ncbi:MAG: Sec translocon subunit SecY [Candidatus Westeberhardia cardiocondylae]|nr:Sec translocon subunit SecY [Candidatus Westeberhardia cardiocondylae]
MKIMFRKIKSFGVDLRSSKDGFNELKKRLLFVVVSLIIFRAGSFIPIPGIDTMKLAKFIENQQGTVIDMFNMFSGGALSRASIFSLGIIPYISASIIVQLLTVIHPKLIEIKKEGGEVSKRKINKYVSYFTLILCIVQSIGIAISLPRIPIISVLIINPGYIFYVTTISSLVCGTIFLMWLGGQITEKGIGNGISVIIFSGIVSGFPSAFYGTIEQVRQGNFNFLVLLFVMLFMFIVIFFVVFVERGQRHIIVNYAKRQQGRRMYASHSTHLPLKVNMSGVIPAVFASSIILFPTTILSWIGNGVECKLLNFVISYLQPNQVIYITFYAISIVFFCFFYTSLVFNSRETAENLKKSGAFISGVRPGEKTAKYINKIMMRLTVIGSMYITIVCLIPDFMRSVMNVPFYFGGTSLLIVVVVIIDFIGQIQSLIMSSQYESILKKVNFRNN